MNTKEIIMDNRSHYDIIDNYKSLLLSLLDETNATTDKYKYDDFIHNANYSISNIEKMYATAFFHIYSFTNYC